MILECDRCDYKGQNVWHDENTGLALCDSCLAKADATEANNSDSENSIKREQAISRLVEALDEHLNYQYAELVDGDDYLDEQWESIAVEALNRVVGMFGARTCEECGVCLPSKDWPIGSRCPSCYPFDPGPTQDQVDAQRGY